MKNSAGVDLKSSRPIMVLAMYGLMNEDQWIVKVQIFLKDIIQARNHVL